MLSLGSSGSSCVFQYPYMPTRETAVPALEVERVSNALRSAAPMDPTGPPSLGINQKAESTVNRTITTTRATTPAVRRFPRMRAIMNSAATPQMKTAKTPGCRLRTATAASQRAVLAHCPMLGSRTALMVEASATGNRAYASRNPQCPISIRV